MASVIIRCDGSPTLGMGHLVRCLALANEFARRSIAPVFAVCGGAEAISRIANAGYEAMHIPVDYGPEVLLALAHQRDAHVFFLDQRDSFSAAEVVALRNGGRLVVVYDDLSERRLGADLCIYPPIPQVASVDWDGFDGEVLRGWEWVLLRPEFATVARRSDYREPPRTLITMGGADPEGFTFDALGIVEQLPGSFTLVVGAMMARADEIRAAARALGSKVRIVSSPSDMVMLMREHDLAFASFGVTAYELAACGVPMALWALTEDHRASATMFAETGIASVATHPGHQTSAELMALVEPWIADAVRRSQAGAAAQALCDGRGVMRIADKIVQLTGHRI